ncbi:MAG: DUF2934 domain-containing protein [Candidatus Acidiferrum sp.]
MSTTNKTVQETEPPKKVNILKAGSLEQLRSELSAKARDMAYFIYQNSGEQPGRDLGHWVEAQSKLMGTAIEIRESGPWFHCNCEVIGIEQAEARVALDETQVLINLSGGIDPNFFPQDGSVPVFYWAKWPQEVDPSTAAGYVKDGMLTIEVKKKFDPPAENPLVERPTSAAAPPTPLSKTSG